MTDSQVPTFDPSDFSTDSYVRRIDKPWGYELHLVPDDLPYMMKLICVNPGARLSLQVHDVKRESWTLLDGPGKVIWENNTGELVETKLEPGVGYTCRLGQKHRLAAGEEGMARIFECSTPEEGNTFRLEDDYARPDETPEQRAIERGES
jgi:mannose-6-phosphate isomerase